MSCQVGRGNSISPLNSMNLCNLKKEMQESILKGPVSPLLVFFPPVKYVSKSNFFSQFSYALQNNWL